MFLVQISANFELESFDGIFKMLELECDALAVEVKCEIIVF